MVILPAFDPRVTVPNTLTGGVNTASRAILLAQGKSQVQAANSLQAQFAARIDQALGKLESSSSSAVTDNLLREQSQLIDRKDRVNQAISVVNKALAQVGFLDNHIKYLNDQLDALEAGTITAANLAVDFDNKIRKLNYLAGQAAQTIKDGKNFFPKNLIGSLSRTTFQTQTLFAPYNSQGDLVQIDGTYLGTDYFITDSNGDFWNSTTPFLDSEAEVGRLSEYTSFPGSPTGVSNSVENITLNSFNTSTDSVTFTLSDSTSVTGTVTRGGLGLLDAFLYGNFDTSVTPNAITRARADLDKAESKILTTAADLRASLATLSSRATVFDSLINAAETDVTDQLRNLQSDNEADVLSAQLQSLVANFNFTLLAARGNTLIKSLVMAQDNTANNPFGDTTAVGQFIVGATINLVA